MSTFFVNANLTGSSEKDGRNMLKKQNLHPLYQTVTEEEAYQMANLGAECWKTCKNELYKQWDKSEDSAKAEGWKEEGRQAMMEILKGKLISAEETTLRLVAAESKLSQMRGTIDSEIAQGVKERLELTRKEYELEKLKELSALKEQIAGLSSREMVTKMLTEAHIAMREKIVTLETQLAQQMISSTKSSHAIGKEGEAIILELLLEGVVPLLPYAEIKDMTNVSHAADFHLMYMLENGQKTKLLIDSKKYKRNVNTGEIEKLYADVDADETAQGGLMVSLESHIFTMKQFQIARTPKQKPVLFMSFCEINPEMRKELIIWAIRVLSDILSQKTSDDKESMIQDIESFLNGVEETVDELDASIRALKKTTESIKVSREKLIQKITNFRGGKPLEEPIETVIESCIQKNKLNMNCGKKCIPGTTFCKAHGKKKEEIILAGVGAGVGLE